MWRGQTRRDFVRRAGLTVMGVGLAPSLFAACGDDDTAGNSTVTTGGGDGGGPLGDLNFLSWEGYDLPVASVEAFKSDRSLTVNATYIGNHDDIQAKIKAGGAAAGYDLITYYQGYKKLYTELEILTKLDESKIPNLAGLLPFWASKEGGFWVDEDGSRTGVPFTWGSIGLTYNSEEVDELPSWYDLLDPKLTGKVAMVDDPAGNLALTAKILGLQSSALPKDKLGDVVGFLEQMVAQTNGIAPSFGDMTTQLVSGEVIAAFHGWSAMNNFAAEQGVTTIKTNLPNEGSHSFCDAYAIPSTAKNPDAALAWINQSLDPVTNAEAATYLVGGVTVAAAVDMLDDVTRGLYPYDDLEALLEKAPLAGLPPVESDEFVTFSEWQDAWQQLKAGS